MFEIFKIYIENIFNIVFIEGISRIGRNLSRHRKRPPPLKTTKFIRNAASLDLPDRFIPVQSESDLQTLDDDDPFLWWNMSQKLFYFCLWNLQQFFHFPQNINEFQSKKSFENFTLVLNCVVGLIQFLRMQMFSVYLLWFVLYL